ncbi:MAG: aminotransferase class IV [bacterium]|nr:aminotransferase class IV [bacterium]
MTNSCNLDGRIQPEADTRISVLDRGFLFGDSVYEVVRTTAGVPFAWPEHFARLRASAADIRMPLDLDDAELGRRIAATIAATGEDHGSHYVRIIVTRGAASAPNIALSTAIGPPSWLIMVRDLPAGSGQPARLQIVDRLRNDRRALDPATKSGNYLNNVLGLAEAQSQGATDCVMPNAAGFVTEASTSNLFARIDGAWCTPPLADGLLAGVTRALVLELLGDLQLPHAERQLTPTDLRAADEIVLTSTLRDVAAVTHLDGRALHDGADRGEPGPAARELMAEFERFAQRLLAVRYAPGWRDLIAD